MTAKFETGKTYNTRSACDYNCVFSFTVTKRTAKTVTINGSDARNKRVGIKVDSSGNEFIFPLGRYSMAPVIRA